MAIASNGSPENSPAFYSSETLKPEGDPFHSVVLKIIFSSMDATFSFFDSCKLLASTVACDNLITYCVKNQFLSFVWSDTP